MKKAYALCGIGMAFVLGLSSTVHGQQYWFDQTSGTTANINCVLGLGGSTVVAGGAGVMLRTINSGNTWTRVSTSWTINGLASRTSSELYGCGNGGVVIRSVNGGVSWSAVTAASGDLQGIYISSPNMWVVGQNGNIYRSTNWGTSWTNQYATGTYLEDVDGDLSNFLFTVGWGGSIYRSTNAGTNWVRVGTPTTENLFGSYYSGGSVCFAVGANGTILYSNNSAATWYQQTTPTTQLLHDIIVLAGRGWAVGTWSTILRTTNYGTNWSSQTVPPPTRWLYAVSGLSTGNTGWAVGQSGTILYTNGTGVEEEESKGEIGVKKHSFRIFPNPMSTTTLLSLNAKTSEKAEVTIYDVAGNLVRWLEIAPNRPTAWNARGTDGRKLPAGVYFLRARAGEYTATEKVVITR